MIVASKDREFNIAKLISAGRLSPKLKTVLKKLATALRKGDRNKIVKLSFVHQYISSGWKMNKQYPYNEDQEYNERTTGTNAYYETDMIYHGDY